MKKNVVRLIVFLSILTITNFVFAETVYLKSGETIKGDMIEETNEYVKIDFQGIPLTYYKDDIVRIEGGAGSSTQHIDSNEDSGGKTTSTPAQGYTSAKGQLEGVYMQYLNAIEKKSTEELKKYMLQKNVEDMEAMAESMDDSSEMFEMMSMMSPKNLKDSKEVIEENGGRLTAVGPDPFGNDFEVVITFKKENGVWKVNEVNAGNWEN